MHSSEEVPELHGGKPCFPLMNYWACQISSPQGRWIFRGEKFTPNLGEALILAQEVLKENG